MRIPLMALVLVSLAATAATAQAVRAFNTLHFYTEAEFRAAVAPYAAAATANANDARAVGRVRDGRGVGEGAGADQPPPRRGSAASAQIVRRFVELAVRGRDRASRPRDISPGSRPARP